MVIQDSVLCIDIGGSGVKAAQFRCTDGNLVLEKFDFAEFVETEESGVEVVLNALSDIVKRNGFTAKDVHISVSGQNSFMKFVKVPSMTSDRNKIHEIIFYEAKQAIPCPIEEVVWDSQLIESATENADNNEIDAMLVIIKNEDAVRIIECVENLGCQVKILEVAPTACYNAARANTVGSSQCEMILNIGGKCSSLIFVDGGRFYVRSIPIAGNTITQQIAKEFNIPFNEAEEMKRRHGFVALGGAYEEPESEVAATVSKIVRNVMTRLHAEISRSINVYRSSQHGRAPEKLYLAGGSSILPFTPQFFLEKLRIPVEYFNPFQIVRLGKDIDQNLLNDKAHLFSELVGLSLRFIGNAPVSITLIPESIRKQHAFQMKRPFFYASAASLLVYLGITCWALGIQYDAIAKKQETFQNIVSEKKKTDSDVKRAAVKFSSERDSFNAFSKYMEHRINWIVFFDALQYALPQNVWLNRVSIEDNPKVKPVSAVSSDQSSNDDIGSDEEVGGIFSRRRSFGAMPDRNDSRSDEKKKDLAKTLKWMNIDAYIICQKGVDFLVPESNVTIGIFSDHLKASKLFEGNLESIQNASNTYCFNITKFRASIELKNAINSPEYTTLLYSRVVKNDDKDAQGDVK